MLFPEHYNLGLYCSWNIDGGLQSCFREHYKPRFTIFGEDTLQQLEGNVPGIVTGVYTLLPQEHYNLGSNILGTLVGFIMLFPEHYNMGL